MATLLTAKFQAWQKKPKPVPVPVPEPKGVYPLTGFLSNDEPRLDRMARLAQAKADGYELAYDDHMYMKSNNTRLGQGLPTYVARRSRFREDKELERAFRGTQRVMRCG